MIFQSFVKCKSQLSSHNLHILFTFSDFMLLSKSSHNLHIQLTAFQNVKVSLVKFIASCIWLCLGFWAKFVYGEYDLNFVQLQV
jgi:hypothetical protein